MSTVFRKKSRDWHDKLVRRMTTAAVLGLIAVLTAVCSLLAQDPNSPPVVEVRAVDTSNFPEITARVRLERVQSQDALRADLYEDGVLQTLTQDPREIAMPVHIGLLLDISSQAYKAGAYDTQFSTWLGTLLDQAALKPYLDKIALFAPDRSGARLIDNIRSVFPAADGWDGFWVEDHNRVLNLTRSAGFDSVAPPATALTKLIRDAIDAFPDDDAASNQLIVFTGSVDKAGPDDFDDLQAACTANNVRVHAVMVAPEETTNRSRMRTITERCNGILFDLAPEPSVSDPLVRTIIDDWRQRLELELRYRTRQPQPRQIEVRVPVPDGVTLEASQPIDLDPVPAAPVVDIELPTTTAEFAANVPVSVDVVWSLPNYLERTVTLSYTIKPLQTDWTAVPVPVEAVGQGLLRLDLPAAAFQPGANILEVRINDELGLEGQAMRQLIVAAGQANEDTAVTLEPPLPPPPPPPPPPALPWAYVLALLLGIGAVAAGIVFWRTPAAPVLLGPPDKSVASFAENVMLKWQPVHNAAAYRVEITYDDGQPLLHDWQPAPERSVGADVLKTEWRVQARDRFKRMGAWSPVWTLLGAGTELVDPTNQFTQSADRVKAVRLVRESHQAGLPKAIALGDVRGAPYPVVTIGRSERYCDRGAILIDKSVSRIHCRIRHQQGNYYIHDEGGSNGTKVNGERVNWNGQALRNGDQIKLGAVILRFEDLPDDLNPGTEPYDNNVDVIDRTETSDNAEDPDLTENFVS